MPPTLWLTIATDDGRGRPDPALGPARRLHAHHRHRPHGVSPFLVPLAWAAILAFATWRVYERVRRRLGERSALAAALMTALVVLLLVIPAGLLSLALAAEAGRTFADFRLSALTLPAWVPATLRELPWFGPRLADQLVRALAGPSALERWILANAGGWAAAVATAAGNA